MLSYKALRFFKYDNRCLRDAVIDNKINQYAAKLRTYDKIIADLKVKVDILESSKESHRTSRDIRFVDVGQARDMDIISQDDVIIKESNDDEPVPLPSTTSTKTYAYIDTLEQVLLLLREGSMTTRQIQERVRKSREHTSRVMNGLYRSGFVTRDTTSKPFKYSITETGLKHLSGLNITARTEQNLGSV